MNEGLNDIVDMYRGNQSRIINNTGRPFNLTDNHPSFRNIPNYKGRI